MLLRAALAALAWTRRLQAALAALAWTRLLRAALAWTRRLRAARVVPARTPQLHARTRKEPEVSPSPPPRAARRGAWCG
jgi:hypothetical protein